MSHFDPAALECLAAIIEEGSFEAAAQRLSLTQSAVSQRIRSLEAQAGTLLLVRSRPARATAAGKLLLRHTQQLRLLRSELAQELQTMVPGAPGLAREARRVAVAVNADSIATWALPAFQSMVEQGLPLEMIAEDQDFTHDWLREGQVLGCISTVRQPLQGCRMTRLGAMNYVAVASPAYAQAHCPQGLGPDNFRRMRFVAFNRKDDMQSQFVGRALGLRRPQLQTLMVPSSEGQVRAAMADWGATVVPQMLVAGLLQQGQLVDIAPTHREPVQLYWHCWNLPSAVLTSLDRALAAAAQAYLTDSGLAASGH